MSRTRIESPVYQQIAVDLAAKIASGKYQEKERIRGRSTLASYYNVSPETIRKAVYILEDVGIVTIHQGIGIEVASAEKARGFQEKYSNIYNLNSLKKELLDLLHQHQEQERLLKEKVNDLIDSTERFRNVNPFIPFELVITRDMKYLGKTASEINFWQNTMATIIAIKRNDRLILSPGSYATLKEGDIWYLIATEESFNRVKSFLHK
ncbi:TrkA C-terminal domain-containing protein [Massiliimalia massiliensis]|uniref:TrkA C-terminal domain-containing protein n=1 Tax=Massiliimalia massiliensis TaxID=1852384 RepID=UPI00098617A8|nr:TrkA C-terminal domain-containing protein [Massiliimalia massiliensis]